MKKLIFSLSFVLYSSKVLCGSEKNQSLLVNTSNGSLHGKSMTAHNGREFIAFLGIPYASPPIGKLRFMPPTPPQKWDGIRDATVEGNACIQRFLNGSEDCLYLNVFTHYTISGQHDDKLFPVMVYIHGGGFYGGSSTLGMYGPEYLLERDIVLVTLQYRLGVFGFLSTEDSEIPGNMGLKDQVRALQWVQENIHLFKGNRSKVTIFGNSAGSCSVHLHMLSPLSKGLFARAISQSGTAQSSFAMIGRGTSKKYTLILAKRLNCTVTNSFGELLQCFQNRNASDIHLEYRKLQDDIIWVLFRPVVEEPADQAFLSISPLQQNTDKPWLVGFNGNEGLFKINMSTFEKTSILIQSKFSQLAPVMLFFDDTCSKPVETAETIYNYYFKNASSVNNTIKSLEQMISDSWFIWPTIQAIRSHNGLMYCYVFNHRGEHSVTEVRGGPKGFGVSHMDELRYLFVQKAAFPVNMNEVDSNISKLLIDLWVNFAEHENPTPHSISGNPQETVENSIVWEPTVNNSDPKFLLIETDKLSIVKNVFLERIRFWRSLPVRDKLNLL